MPKSKSGIIRQTIAPVRTRLLAHAETAREHYSNIVFSADLSACQTESDDISEISNKIRQCLTTLEGKDMQWQQVILGETDDNRETEEQLYAKTALDPESGYLTIMEQSKELLCRLERKQCEAERYLKLSRQPQASPSGDLSRGSVSQYKQTARLPKLSLPCFDGNVLLWQSFWGIFKTNVHDREMSASEKLAYLRGQLTGTALKSIEGVPINDSSYDIAIGILRDRFERSPIHMIGALYSQLKRMPAASNQLSEIISTFDSCEQIFRQLEIAGENTDTNRSLIFDVISKYPATMIKELMERYSVDPESNLGHIRKSIQQYIKHSEHLAEVLEDIEPFGAKPTRQRVTSLRQPHAENDVTKPYIQTSAFAAASPNHDPKSSKQPQLPCYFCSGAHFNSKCNQFTTSAERVRRLQLLGRCDKCLSSAHKGSVCRAPENRLRCFFCKSFGDHVSPLCPKEFASNTFKGRPEPETSLNLLADAVKPPESSLLNSGEQAFLMTASTLVHNPDSGHSMKVRIIFDSGSHRSYVTSTCATSLHLPTIQNEPLKIAVFGTKRTLSVSSRQVSFDVMQRDGSKRQVLAHTTPIITVGPILPGDLPAEEQYAIQSMTHELADDACGGNGSIDILIGSDYFWEFVTGSRVSISSSVHLIKSTLGYLLAGRCKLSKNDTVSERVTLLCLTETFCRSSPDSSFLATKSQLQNNCPDVDEFWSLETIGITDDPLVKDDDRALNTFNETVAFANGRYHVAWPWKDSKSSLPTNYDLALRRFKSLAKRLKTCDNGVIDKYDAVIRDQVKQDVIEKVPDEKDPDVSETTVVHYLPHHPVIKPCSDTTKVRIVYDASAKSSKDNPSLNECLYRGPVLLPDLCQILLRFRIHKVGVVADVEKAFLQLSLLSNERDVTRFFWFRDVQQPVTPENIETYRFCRVPFGIISSPFLLGATIRYHLQRQTDPIARQICDNVYVDNLIISIPDSSQCLHTYQKSKDIFASAGMNLQQWCSNDEVLMDFIPNYDRTTKRENKILGLLWDSEDDTLRLRNNFSPLSRLQSKRDVLHSIASVYDPLGLFQPVLLQAKLFLQRLWQMDKEWDTPISGEASAEWKRLTANIISIFDVRIPRCPFPIGSAVQMTLAVFCDASISAYATCVYLRSWDASRNKWQSNLCYSKSRVTPARKGKNAITLPRLELMGLTIGVRAAKFVRAAFANISDVKCHIFTDSMCVLHWVHSLKPLSVFVGNRIKEIKSLPSCEFHYVSTLDNPADISTRGITSVDIADCPLWWVGPQWLALNQNQWPANENYVIGTDDQLKVEIEERPKRPIFLTMFAGGGSLAPPFGIDATKHSDIRKVQRTTVWCLKFLKYKIWSRLSNITRNKHTKLTAIFDCVSNENHLTASELAQAMRLWVKYIQHKKYPDVIQAVSNDTKHTLVKQLGLRFDNFGILRCHGRLRYADLPFDTVQPQLLAKDCHITNLIITGVHGKLFHAGIGHTLSQLRGQYWIPHGRATVRKVITSCKLCRKYKGPPFALPNMPAWPRERVARSKPFQFTGLDYLGPVNVRTCDGVKKMWICLFTCLAVRAVHLEWVSDCSTSQFLLCMMRFISRRGTPDQIISDNAPQFKVMKAVFDKLWHAVFTDVAVQTYVATRGVTWKFTTELAPWQGGFYERLVGIVKNTFRVVIGRRMLNWEEFATLITEVEAIVNSRPITYVYGDFDSGFPLRPVDFLSDLPTGTPTTNSQLRPHGLGEAGKEVLRIWKHRQTRLNTLWRIWYDEYLLSLRERRQSSHKERKGAVKSSPNVGDVVMIKDTDAPRGSWKMGRVKSLVRSNDGAVRSAELRLSSNSIIRRSVSHIFPLEIESQQAEDSDTSDFLGFSEQDVTAAEERVRQQKDAGRRNLNAALTTAAFTLAFELSPATVQLLKQVSPNNRQ